MKKLTNAEERIMQYYWNNGPMLVSDIIQMMDDPKPAHSTISTITRKLEEKGYLDHTAYGRTFQYFPIIEKDSYSRRNLKDMITDYFEGSTEQLLSFIVKEEKIDKKALNELINKFEKAEK